MALLYGVNIATFCWNVHNFEYVIAAGSLVAGAVWSVALTPDGRRVVTGSEDFTARVWDVVSGNCAHVLDGHTGWVVHVCTTADGLRCATASHDGTARSACCRD